MNDLNRAEIESLGQKFDDIIRKLGGLLNLDETISELENYSEMSYKIVEQYQLDIVILKEQVLQLDMLNKTLKTECFANTIFIPEL